MIIKRHFCAGISGAHLPEPLPPTAGGHAPQDGGGEGRQGGMPRGKAGGGSAVKGWRGGRPWSYADQVRLKVEKWASPRPFDPS